VPVGFGGARGGDNVVRISRDGHKSGARPSGKSAWPVVRGSAATTEAIRMKAPSCRGRRRGEAPATERLYSPTSP
jgi:hypothetical protein